MRARKGQRKGTREALPDVSLETAMSDAIRMLVDGRPLHAVLAHMHRAGRIQGMRAGLAAIDRVVASYSRGK